MKSIIFSLLIFYSVSKFAQGQVYAPFKVQMAETPKANPSPLLKIYGNQSTSNFEMPKTYSPPPQSTYIPPPEPEVQRSRIIGTKISTQSTESISLIIEVTKNTIGQETITVVEYKTYGSEIWQKLGYGITAYKNNDGGETKIYNYRLYFAGGTVYFYY